MSVTIEPYASADALAAPDLAAITAIANDVWAEWVDGERRMSVAAYADLDRQVLPSDVHERRLVRDSAGRVVAVGSIEWRRQEPRVGASVARVMVDPSARATGAGRALGEHLVALAQSAGRIGVSFEAAVGSPADVLCERAGLREDLIIELNRAPARSATYGLLAGWIKTGEEAPGYSLITYDSRCPDELAEGFTVAREVMNDAPRYEGEPEAVYSVEELRSAEATNVLARHDWWAVGVRHDESGEIVGISDLFLPTARPWIAFQGDTGVAEAHRGHRLGAWMKATNHQRLRRERPEVEVVSTWNATQNAPMLRINRALGFTPAQHFRVWYLPLG